MAILQLSRITHRKGLDENLPTLAGGELGWALDQRKLYIGNGKTEDGAPELGNTEILTEFSDLDNVGLGSYKRSDGMEVPFPVSPFVVTKTTAPMMVFGEEYQIISLDDGIGGVVTDFTSLGATDNTIGTIFTYDGTIPLGTGTVIGVLPITFELFTATPTEHDILANSYKFDYNILAGTESRMGAMIVSYGGAVTYTDDYNESIDIGVTLSAVAGIGKESIVNITIPPDVDIVINYSIVRLD